MPKCVWGRWFRADVPEPLGKLRYVRIGECASVERCIVTTNFASTEREQPSVEQGEHVAHDLM